MQFNIFFYCNFFVSFEFFLFHKILESNSYLNLNGECVLNGEYVCLWNENQTQNEKKKKEFHCTIVASYSLFP